MKPFVNKGKTCPRCDRPARKRGFCEIHYIDERRQGRLPLLDRPGRRLRSGWQPIREELAWAAGFVDGEGSFYVVRSETCSSGYLPCFSVSQSGDTEVLSRFIDAVGLGKIDGPQIRKTYLPQFKITCSGYEQAQYILGVLWPWLGTIKKEAAIRSLRAWRSK